MDQSAIKEINAQSVLKELNTTLYGGDGVLAVPDGTNFKDMYDFSEIRRWRSGKFITASCSAFCKYVANKDFNNNTHVFISMDSMNAQAIFNIEDSDGNPLRGDDVAKLCMKMTPQANALNELSSTTWAREDLAAWMEEWGSFFSFYDGEGNYITTSKAIYSIRKMTVEQIHKVESHVGDMKHSKSSLDEIEARGAEVTVHGFRAMEFCYYDELPRKEIDVKFDMITRSDNVMLKPRVVGVERNKIALREELASLLIEEIEGLEHVYLGSFSR
ncbi:MAG: YfdQ family protein [Candidatus Thiodiazotropha lotti]|nr:YfdQ family protein [Candidatus Thiodiazotropha lotti]MCW4221781.1 YfdQ family protein [Candidatus Thiodiazotropha lotti]